MDYSTTKKAPEQLRAASPSTAHHSMASRIKRGGGTTTLLKAGIPLVSLLLGGSFLLGHFMQTHMDIKDKRTSSISKRKFDLDEEHKLLIKKLDLDNFSLSRIPRPEGLEDDKKKGEKK